MIERLDKLQRKHPVLGFGIAVIYKYADDQGGYLAVLMTYYAFLALFPLLLLLTTGVGIVLDGNPGLQERVLNSTLSQFPVIGDQLGQPQELSGGIWGVVIGIVGALYGASGAGQAAQNAMNTVWAVPRNKRPNPIFSRLRSLLLLTVLALTLVGTTVMSTYGGVWGLLGRWDSWAIGITAVVVNSAVFMVAYKLSTTNTVTYRDVLPGAIVMAILWQLLQTFGTFYVTQVVKNASTTNSVFAVVLGLLAYFYLAAVAVVLTAEINVVRVHKLYPRALLTPFTDEVELTQGDRTAYTRQAKAQRAKGFEQVTVTFEKAKKTDEPEPR
ncbi:YihY family inner membrane protein [Williamsia limnetica]|jgi:YihY family inner membrane protein|uniref:YihY family inner membrane protein n=1 Tax=Williamsia limnetica TaxID=882452 RepID=A0A318RJS3_WILLI|nr:YihY/virulence factor BrkB family protein [Williamsia limnetica]PYE18090.1 YihY family inner membrane protein [Williamsia limnetica]